MMSLNNWIVFASLLVACPPLVADTGKLLGCTPEVTVKTVKETRREITVGIVGEDLPRCYRNGKPDVDGVIAHWMRAMDGIAAAKPDIFILPEISDFGPPVTLATKREWAAARGNRILNAFREYARAHHAYVVYPTYRTRSDGRFANCAIWIDREGDVISIYDKYQPTVRDLGHDEFPVVPGTEAVVVQTDFGRVGTAICFDLNFEDILVKYMKWKPDVIVFPSYFDGGNLRRTWATLCGSYVVASTVGRHTKTVIGPSGEPIIGDGHPLRTFTVKINTNFRVLHADFNKDALKASVAKYGNRIEMRYPGPLGLLTFLSNDATLPVDDVISECGIETWAHYHDRSIAAREAALKD